MKTSSRKVLSAAIGSAGVLALVISAMAVGPDTREPRSAAAAAISPISDQPVVRQSSASSVKSDGSAELARMEAAQAELMRKVERLEALLADSRRDEVPREDEQPAAGPDESRIEESPEAQEERVSAQIREQIEFLETSLGRELADKEWAKPAMIALGDAFETEAAEGIDLLEADCRSSMCRIRLAFDPSIAEESFGRLQSIVPWSSEGFFHIDDVDSGEAVLYLSREDHQLPRRNDGDAP